MADLLDRLRVALADRYTIGRELGRGGMAIVYLAEDLRHERKVALKVLRPELATSLGAERFLREIRIAAQLSHPHILPLFDSGRIDGSTDRRIDDVGERSTDPTIERSAEFLFYTMPYVEGESLRDRLNRERQLPLEDALAVAAEVADALGYAHAQGIIHRDIKPENVLFQAGHAVVSDFGIARALSAAGSASLTETGLAVGTPAYMSPEQGAGATDLDGRSDIYSLGCVLYEMLSGDAPYLGHTPQAIIAKKLSEPTPRISVVRETVPAAVEAALTKALAKHPADRFATAQQFADALTARGAGSTVGQAAAGAAGERGREVAAHRRRNRRWLVAAGLAAIAAVLLALNVGGLRGRLAGRAAGEADLIRLAVLPFENLTGDPEQEYLSDGLTEEMITQLGRLHPQRLSVIGRLSVMRYKNSGTPIDRIGRELHVDYVLAGSTRRDAGRIRISAELVRVRGQAQVWTEAYESELSGILALQRDVARRVAGSLALELLPAEEARLANVRRVDPAAYEAYLRGSQSRLSLTEGGLETAERYFNLALQIDPDYAAAWAGIARVWNGRAMMTLTPAREGIRKSKEATLKALALDEVEWEAHRALAGILTWGDWDWPAAERQWDRILEINPNDGEALATYSHFLMNMGRPEEAMAHVERALELDPFNVKVRHFYVIDLVYVRRYDDAIAEAREVLRVQPDAPVARSGLYWALYLKGMFDEALAVDRQRFGGDSEILKALEHGYAEGGYAGAQERIADVWAGRFGRSVLPSAYDVSLKYLIAGNQDRALEWLERAYQDGDVNMPYLALPIFDPLRSDPRFQGLLRRMNLPDADAAAPMSRLGSSARRRPARGSW